MSSKAFLLHECQNVKTLLENTLRYDYGLDGSRHFFDECSARLSFLINQLEATSDADVAMLASLGRFVDELASLICRIERSSLGEYSWPFVEELKKISSAICRESTLADPDVPPKVYVFADGGLSSYAIYPEQSRPSASQKRLLTIVFPKSLKNFVLLHPILGHELGHAVWQVSKHQQTLNREVIRHLLLAGGKLENSAATAGHLYSATAPQEVKDYLATLTSVNQSNIFNIVDWGAWVEEILCDLIGLVTFGPGFVAAHSRLLYGTDPSGLQVGPQHPPVAWRVNMVLSAAKILGHDKLPAKQSPLKESMTAFWQHMNSFRRNDPWYDFFDHGQLKDAVHGIQALFVAHPPAAYPPPSNGRIAALVEKIVSSIPPIGHKLARDLSPKNINVDFRHIIYAGWIAERHSSNIPFKTINQLCEHAIMQQGAIEMILKEPSR